MLNTTLIGGDAMSKAKKETYKLSEVHALKLENILLKMSAKQQAAKEINEQFGELAKERNVVIEEARADTKAPKDFMVSADLATFVPPPPAPPAPPDPKE
jgi:hypothetical protein